MNLVRRTSILTTIVFVVACLLSTFAAAQVTTSGRVLGVVTDQSGAVVAGATVTLQDLSTGESITATSNSDGHYVFNNVRLGNYTVTATKSGFSTQKVTNVHVDVSEDTTENFKMPVGAATQTVEVSSTSAAELQTLNATVGQTVDTTQLENLPNFGHDASSLAIYQPMVTSGGQVAGALADQNTFTLDGGNATSDLDGSGTVYTNGFSNTGSGNGVVPTPVASVEEVRVASANQTADFIGGGGGEYQFVTKHGTDQFHGSGYDYFESSDLAANSWGNNRSNIARSVSHQNRFGASVGGPLIPWKILGGKTYFFVNYEGRIYHNQATATVTVPMYNLENGIITEPNAAGTLETYNLKTSTACGTAGTTGCDPRGLGISPTVYQYWQNYMPTQGPTNSACLTASGAITGGDTYNTCSYEGTVALPTTDNTVITRFDHDFSSNWRFFVSQTWFKETANDSNNLYDFGGIVPGDKKGTITNVGVEPDEPAFWVAALTGQITPNLTNQFNFNYTRNYWAWNSPGVIDPMPGIPAGLSFDGSGSGRGLDAYDVGWGDVRARLWNGHDWNYKDDVSWLHGNHLLQFGGTFTHYWLHHVRNDDATSAVTALRYIVGNGAGADLGSFPTGSYQPPVCPTGASATAACITSGEQSSWQSLYYTLIGTVGVANEVVTRQGASLTANPLGTPAFDFDVEDVPDFYVTDTWHMRPSISLVVGLNYGISLAPREESGKQTVLVDSSGQIVTAANYYATKAADALQGINYDPTLGFEPAGAYLAGHSFYQNWYGGLAPRISAAWNPTFNGGLMETIFGHNSSVLRGGWSRLMDRQNNVATVLAGLLGVGFMQGLACNNPIAPSANGGVAACSTTALANAPATSFRLGVDGNVVPFPAVQQTLALPVLPGVNAPTNGAATQIDYNLHPGIEDEFTLSLQRALPGNMILELGYVGRRGRDEFAGANNNAAPYMMTLGGQSFAQAFGTIATYVWENQSATAAQVAASVPVQPFFEAALGGASSAYCKAYASCTAAVINGELSRFSATDEAPLSLWSDLEKKWIFGPALINSQGLAGVFTDYNWAKNTYNAGEVSLTERASHGLTLNGNLTWASSFDDTTGGATQSYGNNSSSLDPYDPSYSFGPSGIGYPVQLNVTGTYQLPFGPGQKGLVGRAIGGWSLSPIFTWHSGAILQIGSGSSQPFGESDNFESANAQLTDMSLLSGAGLQHVIASTSIGSTANKTTQMGYFSNPAAVYDALRPTILGVDTTTEYSIGHGFPAWNMNLALNKNLRLRENLAMTLEAQASNVFNHDQWANPSLSYSSPNSFGDISSKSGNRTIELGAKLVF